MNFSSLMTYMWYPPLKITRDECLFMNPARYSESYQEYIETIYRLTLDKDNKKTWITNAEIADSLHIKPPSVTEMLEKLADNGLVEWKKRHGVRLTEKGTSMGKQILDLHFLLEEFFTVVLDIDDEDLKHRIACSLEHHILSEPRFVEAMRRAISRIKDATSGT